MSPRIRKLTGTVLLLVWIIVYSLAAMVIGRFTNLGRVVVASVALGALDAAISRSSSGPAAVAPVMLGVIVVALLVQRAPRGRVGGRNPRFALFRPDDEQGVVIDVDLFQQVRAVRRDQNLRMPDRLPQSVHLGLG
mgnify:CR=1 FL=1